jgi:hypothetical protein
LVQSTFKDLSGRRDLARSNTPAPGRLRHTVEPAQDHDWPHTQSPGKPLLDTALAGPGGRRLAAPVS